MKFNYYIFILFWFLINIFQAATTELTSDEGYYWYYASKLSWGYYDHPPLLAFCIYIGIKVFATELGVRLIQICLLSSSLFPFFNLFPKRILEQKWIYIALLSLPLYSYLTFIAFPDAPLIAFFMFFLWAYKRFLEKNDCLSILIMILSLTLMFYAKYHAVLIPILLISSNLKLLKNPRFYFIIGIAFLLYLPHLFWQIEHDYPSFKYHLQARSRSFKIGYLIQYLSQQILVIGPLLVFSLLYKVKNDFERFLKFSIVGVFIFFFLMAFRGFVHLHWTSLAIYPIFILAILYVEEKQKQKLFIKIVLPFALLFFIFRLQLSFYILPFNHLNVDYYHDRKLWAEDISQLANGRKVIFENQLREAPLYSFYSENQKGIALYPWIGKKSEYEIRNEEDSIQNQNVVLIRKKAFEKSTKLLTRMGKEIHYLEIDSLNSFFNINLLVKDLNFNNQTLDIKLSIKNHRNESLNFDGKQRLYAKFIDGDEKGNNILIEILNDDFNIKPHSQLFKEFKIDCSELQSGGKYDMYLYIHDGTFNSICSKKLSVQIP